MGLNLVDAYFTFVYNRYLKCSAWRQVSIQYIGITIDVFQKWNIVEKEIFTVLLGGV
jgi:hypothetical protein